MKALSQILHAKNVTGELKSKYLQQRTFKEKQYEKMDS